MQHNILVFYILWIITFIVYIFLFQENKSFSEMGRIVLMIFLSLLFTFNLLTRGKGAKMLWIISIVILLFEIYLIVVGYARSTPKW